jgi:hypothetical protein
MDKSHLRDVQAAPPDDGGNMGSYTLPQQMLTAAHDDTRASETIGEEPLRTRKPNAGLLWFWISIVGLSGLLALLALLRA